ncbi:MAG: hypothetical protein HKP58_06295 [Desulfatitalea sp.]|nr:hypothetical protein [Desulfatitalea sp.]NNK00008.1 hypothetical protein [Desulfatitalea sp.]
MSNSDPKNEPQNNDAEFDDEFESLSSDEKAAFEKIMAEINTATGVTPDGSPNTPQSTTTAPDPDASDEAAPDAGQQDAPATKEAPQDDEALNDDQQAAFNQIMAEIESGKQEDTQEAPASASSNGQNDLSEDQNTAARAEIETKRQGGGEEAPLDSDTSEAIDQADEEALSEDQKAAMSQIMAEIEAKRKSDKTKPDRPDQNDTEQADSDADDEPLAEDQQAALDQIMAEIEAKRKSDRTKPDRPDQNDTEQADSDADDEPLAEDQQAALDQIMAEIEAKRKSEPVEAATEDQAADTQEAASDDAETDTKDTLSMEEFDNELNSLLASSQADDKASEPADTSTPTQGADVEPDEGVNAALKAQLNEIEQAKNQSGEPSEATTPPDSTESKEDFPILQEVTVAPKSKRKGKTEKKGAQARRAAHGRLRRALTLCAGFVGIVLLSIGGYSGVQRFWLTPPEPVAPTQTEQTSKPAQSAGIASPDAPPNPSAFPPEPTLSSIVIDQEPSDTRQAPQQDLSLEGFITHLAASRDRLQNKISDIEQLQSYYGRGIDEEIAKIEDSLENGRIPTFQQAVADQKIELGLKSIQRRMVYRTKLNAPLTQLRAMSEELLYLERKARIYRILKSGIVGLPVEAFKQQAEQAVDSFLQYNTQLSIDRVVVDTPELATIWNDLSAQINKKAELLARRMPLNRAISREICKGNFERKFKLTALSPETARCLAKWKGKDLYLNSLNELTPQTAEILATWPGEWLSLNGLRELSPETAKHLAQWPGKRISLNGLTNLSADATAYLSQWRGEQLEMVGLLNIGRWENYGTRLFLSEKLRQRLEE